MPHAPFHILDGIDEIKSALNLLAIPGIDDARIPDIETLSYGTAFANAQVPSLTSKLFSLCLIKDEDATPIDDILLRVIDGVLQIRNSANSAFRELSLSSIPTMDTAHIPNLSANKITTDTLALDRIPTIPLSTKVSEHDLTRHPLAIIPMMDDAHIPNLEGLSYGGAFAVAQIPTLTIAKISDIPGTIANILTDHDLTRHPLSIIPTMDDGHIPNVETLSYASAFATAQIPNLSANKITSDVLALARIPTMDDTHIPNLETLSYGGRFAVAQIPWSSGIDQNLLPDAPNTRQVGTSASPFAKVYANELHGTAYYADIIFQEKSCEVCGKKFVVGDDLALKVVEVEEKGVHAVPIHRECAGERK